MPSFKVKPRNQMSATLKRYTPSSTFVALLLAATTAGATGFDWYYQNKKLTLNYNFNIPDYNYYKSKSKFGQNMSIYAEQDKGHSYLASFAEELRKTAQQNHWYGSNERNMIIRFVQQAITYKTDPYNYGYDYPRYPIETLYEKIGDCEDKACLLTALLKTLGHDAVLLEFKDHMAAGVAGTDLEGSSYVLNGKKFYYTETTGTFDPGNNPGYKTALVKTVKQTAFALKNPSPTVTNSAKKIKPERRKFQTYTAPCKTTSTPVETISAYGSKQIYIAKKPSKYSKTKRNLGTTSVVHK